MSRDVLVALLVALPWLNPLASGPSPAVLPWLLALAATAGLLLLVSLRATSLMAHRSVSLVRRWAQPVAWAWLLAGVVSSVLALLQYAGAAAILSPWVNQTSLGEAFANLRQRNQFASLTNIALAALVWLGIHGHLAGRRQWLLWVFACLLAVGNVASSSRTGLIQLVLLCALPLFWRTWREPVVRRVLLAAGLAYGVATLALPWLAGFELSSHGAFARLHAGDTVCASRLTLWSNVLHLMAQKPWLGWGWGELDYAHYMTFYPGARFCDILDNAHNLPLHLAVELGIPVAVLVCGVVTWLVVRARPWRETDATRQLAWSVLALIALHSMLEYPLWYGPFQMAVGLCIAMLWTTPAQGHVMTGFAGNFRSNRPLAPYLSGLVAILMIAFMACAAFEYYRVSQIYLEPDKRAPAYREDTLNKIRGTRWFGNQLRFAELTLTPLTPANAAQVHALSTGLLHFSPEPRVIEKLLESAAMLGQDDEVSLHRARYRAAFPQEFAKWQAAQDAKSAPVQ
jgi:O-antigen ligase